MQKDRGYEIELLAQRILADVMGIVHFTQPGVGNFVIKAIAVLARLLGLILGVVCPVQGHIIRGFGAVKQVDANAGGNFNALGVLLHKGVQL